MLENLLLPDEILADVWRRLLQGKAEPDHPFHAPVVANLNELEGVAARTVILRKVDVEARVLVFHTDRRSAKFEHLQQDHSVAWVFYDRAARLQIRAGTSATLHTKDAVAHEQWVASPQSQPIYATPLVSGTVLDSIHRGPPAPVADGRDNFSVVRCVIHTLDWLYLHPGGHRRARFTFPEGVMHCEWLAP